VIQRQRTEDPTGDSPHARREIGRSVFNASVLVDATADGGPFHGRWCRPAARPLSTKGQVILPAAVRRHRNWNAGTRLIVEETPDGVLLKPAPAFPSTTPEQVSGCLRYAGEPKSLQEMQDGITAEVRRQQARGRY
jgi:AbrB family looped-hinge helix DNA binding protein